MNWQDGVDVETVTRRLTNVHALSYQINFTSQTDTHAIKQIVLSVRLGPDIMYSTPTGTKAHQELIIHHHLSLNHSFKYSSVQHHGTYQSLPFPVLPSFFCCFIYEKQVSLVV